MFHTGLSRAAACLFFSAAAVSVLCCCTKRLDTSSDDKYYNSYEKVVRSLSSENQKKFDDGMNMIWFYSEDDAATKAELHGKTGEEILSLIDEKTAKLPTLDTSSREAFESSLKKIQDTLPSSKKKAYADFVNTLPAYRPGDRRLAGMNGLPFHKLVENFDFANGQNPDLQKK